MSPTLSIAIPTRNRRELLQETLRSVLEDAERLGCEVVVSDNASMDGTGEFLGETARRHPVLRVNEQLRNVGLDRNMRDAAGLCRGSWVWLLGDDDVVAPGGLGVVLGELAKDPDLLVLDAWHSDAALGRRHRNLPPPLHGLSLADPVEAFRHAWDRMHFSAFVARRPHLAPPLWERFLGTSHAYSGAVWQSLAERRATSEPVHVLFGSDPAVMLRSGEKSWRKGEATVYFEEIPRWLDLLPALYESAVIEARRQHWAAVFHRSMLLRLRAAGLIDSRYVAARMPRDLPRRLRWRALLYARIPRPLAAARIRVREIKRSVKLRLRGSGR